MKYTNAYISDKIVSNTFGLFYIVLLVILLAPNVSYSKEASGWINYGAEILSNDLGCGADSSVYDVVAKSGDTEIDIIVPEISIEVKRKSDFAIVDSSVGTLSNTTGTVCFNMETEYISVKAIGGGDYYDVDRAGVFIPLASSLGDGKRVRGHLHMRQSVLGHEYRQLSPVGGVWINYDPMFMFELMYLPVMHNVTKLNNLSYSGSIGSSNVSMSGGAQIISLPKKNLTDGTHYWYATSRLDGTTALASLTPLSAPAGPEFFYIDRVMPIVNMNNTPVFPSNSDFVQISVDSQDVASGLESVQIFVDGAVAKVCNYFGVTSVQSCVVDKGPFIAGSSHTYYAVVRDRAGNSELTAVSGFSVDPVVLPDLFPFSFLIDETSGGLDPVLGTYNHLNLTYSAGNSGGSYVTESPDIKFSVNIAGSPVSVDSYHDDIGAVPSGGTTNLWNKVIASDVPAGVPVDITMLVDHLDEVDEGTSGGELNNMLTRRYVFSYLDPGISLTIEPSGFVRYGTGVDLVWDIVNPSNIDSCVIQGSGIAPASESIYTSGGPTSGIIPDVGPVTSKSEYQLTCTTIAPISVFTDTAIIETVGMVQET